jgi:pseudoazurin
MNRRLLLASGGALLATNSIGWAQSSGAHTIEMLNKHPEDRKQSMVFYPRILSVMPGDVVTFKSTDKGHNSVSLDDMLPEGGEEWKGRINQDIEVTFAQPGFYGYQCVPHASMGMVGLIVVEGEGKLDNLDEARGVRHRGRSKSAWEEIWAEAEDAGLLEATVA